MQPAVNSLPQSSAGIDSVAEFSSYGPTQDGRFKPDLVAPGQALRSAAPPSNSSESLRAALPRTMWRKYRTEAKRVRCAACRRVAY